MTYLDHFGLRQAPFGLTPDPALFYNSQSHQRALDWIEAGIAARVPILSLTGATGTGKTTLLRLLLDRHGSEWTIGLVSGLHSRRDSILVQAHYALGLPGQGDSPVQLSDQIRHSAEATRTDGGFTVLMVDEAEALDAERISALASLAMDSAEGGALTLLLVGRPELRSLLATPKLRNLRIAEGAHAVLSPLSDDDTPGYVEHRLARSGARAPIFSLRAIQMLHSLGMGMPRFINVLADYCLTIAAEDEVSRLDRAWVSAVLHEASATGVLSRLAKLAKEGPPQSAADALDMPGPRAAGASQRAAAPDRADAPDPAAPPSLSVMPAAAQGAPSSAEPREDTEAGQATPIDGERRRPALQRSHPLRALPRPDPAPPVAAATAPRSPVASASQSPRGEPRRRAGPWLSSAVVVLACAAAFAWLRPGQAPAPDAPAPAPPSASAAVDRAATAPGQPAVSPPASQSPAPVPAPVAITPAPAVRTLMQDALKIEVQDPAGAALAYTRAAIRGRARAAYYLGQLHETGTGVEPNPGMARLWYAAAADLPVAQRRLRALAAAEAPAGTPAAPAPIFQARLDTGASEMIWRVPDGVAPVRFRVELLGPSGQPLPAQETAVPGLIVPFPVSAWRVIAIGADGTESPPSAMVRMIPAGE